ncbi:hypothetical protein CPC08DRAFT_72619 [Agrocybe pediades]|nr:hypothetical protein CPC08DRAFT_72619 [Agrocybe pediades]
MSSATFGNASSSRLGLTTPIRATTSTLKNRAAPSIPPATQVYEPLVKALFRQRLKFVLLLSALATWVINGAWIIWQEGGSQSVGLWEAVWLAFSPSSLFLALLSWVFVALPITVLRKMFLTGNRSNATSPMASVKAAFARKNMRTASSVYLASSVLALFIHTIMAYQHEIYARGDPKLSIFVKSRKHPHYLNGRLLLLLLTQLCAALAFTLRSATADRFAYRWPSIVTSKDPWKALALPKSTIISVAFATFSVIAASVVFGSIRMLLPLVFKVPIVSSLLRPFAYHFLRGSWTITLPLLHLPLLVRTWFLAFTTFLNWELTDALFEYVVSETVPVSVVTADPNTTIIAGITSTDSIFKYFAYSELKELALDSSNSAATRRAALFGDQQMPINLWNNLARESLLLLGKDYQLFLRRGKPEPAPLLPVAKPTTVPATPFATPAPLLRQRIFRAAPESPGQAALDALASDGPIAKAIDVGADATHVPELFRSVETKVLTSPVVEEAKKNVETAKGFGANFKSTVISQLLVVWKKYCPEQVQEICFRLLQWWEEERISRVVEASLPFRELDVLVVDEEDKYGVVQRDIPKILEAMVSFLTAVEEYQIKVTALQKPLPEGGLLSAKEQEEHDALVIEIQKAQDTLLFVNDGLKEGIARIVRTFGDKLQAFKFPPKVAGKLQGFLDHT